VVCVCVCVCVCGVCVWCVCVCGGGGGHVKKAVLMCWAAWQRELMDTRVRAQTGQEEPDVDREATFVQSMRGMDIILTPWRSTE
jgi:hypothetical protein